MTTGVRSSATWAAPDARLILKASADGSPEWLATRRTGITSTGATVLGGVNKRSNLYSVRVSYFDEPEDDPIMADVYWYGHEVEPMLAARRFEDRAGFGTRNVGTYAHREYRTTWPNPTDSPPTAGLLSIKSSGCTPTTPRSGWPGSAASAPGCKRGCCG